jgi:hypothetical protein
MVEAAGDRRWAKRHGGGDRVMSSARRWRWMIVDGRGGAEVRHRESRQDCRPGEYVSRVKYVKVARSVVVGVESVSRRCVQVLVPVKRSCC